MLALPSETRAFVFRKRGAFWELRRLRLRTTGPGAGLGARSPQRSPLLDFNLNFILKNIPANSIQIKMPARSVWLRSRFADAKESAGKQKPGDKARSFAPGKRFAVYAVFFRQNPVRNTRLCKDHFMAALLIPVMMYFCRIRNRNTMGMMAITAPAMISL